MKANKSQDFHAHLADSLTQMKQEGLFKTERPIMSIAGRQNYRRRWGAR